MLRAGLAATALLLLAGGVAYGVGSPAFHQAAASCAHEVEGQVAAWWAAHRPAAVSAAAPLADGAPRPLLGGLAARLRPLLASPRCAPEPPVLHVTLELPGQRSIELAEDASLEQLVARLLEEQAGLRPTSIELISVERVSEEARPSPWRAVLRAAGALRLPAGWHLPGATTAAAEEDRVGQVAALAADAALQQLAGLQPLPLGAAPSEAEERERQRQEWAALLAANGIDEAGQRLPLSAFDDAYLDGTDFAEAEQASGRRLKQEIQLDGESVRLFGPPRTPAELAAAARGDTADTAAELAAAVAQAEAAAAQLGFAGAAGEPLEIVVELVLVEGEEEQVQARWSLLSDSWRSGLDGDGASLAELLVQLPEPAGAAQLGRKAAAGAGSGWAGLGGLFAVLGGSQQQPSRPQVPASPWVLAAVDTLFVAATSMAVVCAVLLAADIRRHGWRRCSCGSGSGRGSSGRGYPAGAVVSSKELLAPLLVVAAEEVAAAGAKGQH